MLPKMESRVLIWGETKLESFFLIYYYPKFMRRKIKYIYLNCSIFYYAILWVSFCIAKTRDLFFFNNFGTN